MHLCAPSSGLKSLVTPLIAGLVECGPKKMWTYERFFTEVYSIDKKKVVHVFDVRDVSLHHIYVNEQDRFADCCKLAVFSFSMHVKSSNYSFSNTEDCISIVFNSL